MSVVELPISAPHDLDAERSILGALMVHQDGFATAQDRITPDVFFRQTHGNLFAAMCSLSTRGQEFTAVSIKNELKRMNMYHADLLTELATIMHDVHTAAGLETYCEIVMEKFILRRLIAISGFITDRSRADDATAQDILDEAEEKLFDISKQSYTAGFAQIGQIMAQYMPTVESLIPDRSGRNLGIPTGFPSLDRITCGFQRSNLVLIAGRPSMGKTSLALNIAHNLAVNEGMPVGVCSLEQSREELVTRAICAEACVDSQRLRRNRMRRGDVASLQKAMGRLRNVPLYIDDSGGNTIKEVRAKARLLKARHGIEMLIIDYLQLMSLGRRVNNREQEVSTISRSLKALAKELEIPVVALSQLSRQVENRDDKRPRLADLRESGALEQDSDVVIFLYRPEKYWCDDEDLKGIAEVIVAKQRNGPLGNITMTFAESYMRFNDMAVPGGAQEPEQGVML